MNLHRETAGECREEESSEVRAPASVECDSHPSLVSRPWERDQVLNLRMAEDQEQRRQRAAALQIRIDVAWWILCGGFYGSIFLVIALMSPWMTRVSSPSGIRGWFEAYGPWLLPALGLCMITIVVGGVVLTHLLNRARVLGVELEPRSKLWSQYQGALKD